MTILISVKFKESVMFISDTLRNKINADGSYAGLETNTAQKIKMIRKSAVMATAGMGSQGELAVDQIKSIIQHGEKRNVNQVVQCCTEVLNASREIFIKYNQEVSYNKLAALIGGCDEFSGKPYLYLIHSDLNFNIIEKSVVSLGVNSIASIIEKEVDAFISKFPNENFTTYASTFSEILRRAAFGSQDVGQHTFVLELKNEGNPMVWFLNENGLGMPLPSNYII